MVILILINPKPVKPYLAKRVGAALEVVVAQRIEVLHQDWWKA